jgi:hypothetical protein
MAPSFDSLDLVFQIWFSKSNQPAGGVKAGIAGRQLEPRGTWHRGTLDLASS